MISDKVEVRILGKGKKVRRVIIPKSLFDAVRSVYQGKTWLFESRNGRPLDRNNIRKQLKKTGQAIGLENLHPHMLRHTRATDMIINKGVSTKAASQYLGHASTAITLDMYVKDRVDVDLLFSRDAI
jgi:integrase